MKKTIKTLIAVMTVALVLFAVALPAFADEAAPVAVAAQTEENTAETAEVAAEKAKTAKAWAAGIVITVVAATAAIGMALAISKSADSIARQPEAAGNIRTSLMLGLVFIETAIIYALIVAILIVFVL